MPISSHPKRPCLPLHLQRARIIRLLGFGPGLPDRSPIVEDSVSKIDNAMKQALPDRRRGAWLVRQSRRVGDCQSGVLPPHEISVPKRIECPRSGSSGRRLLHSSTGDCPLHTVVQYDPRQGPNLACPDPPENESIWAARCPTSENGGHGLRRSVCCQLSLFPR